MLYPGEVGDVPRLIVLSAILGTDWDAAIPRNSALAYRRVVLPPVRRG